MNKEKLHRRSFLKRSLATAASATPLMALLGSIETLEAAETGGEYKAIVCVLLEGGADSCNMVAPSDAAYGDYQGVRGSFALAKDSLLPLTHANSNGLNPGQHGMRDNMTEMQRLFNEKKLSIIANVGPLVKPVTQQQVLNGELPLPPQLFAHNTQRALWMMGNANVENNGWAARAADTFYPTPNPYVNVTVGGDNFMQSGGIAEAISFKESKISPNTMKSFGFGPDCGGGKVGTVYQDIHNQTQSAENKLLSTFATRRIDELKRKVELRGLFDGKTDYNFDNGSHEVGKSLGDQLELVAEILSIRDNFPGQRKRQIFFVNHRGWDTHNSDNKQQAGYLSDSLGVFNDTLAQMGITNQVTTFTISDFGRSLTSNGAGTDHGWGGHAYVMGGAVKGGDIFGKMPVLKKGSPDTVSDRLIPTTSVEQYLATIVKWFGATDNELNAIFPNLNTFTQKNMGFMV